MLIEKFKLNDANKAWKVANELIEKKVIHNSEKIASFKQDLNYLLQADYDFPILSKFRMWTDRVGPPNFTVGYCHDLLNSIIKRHRNDDGLVDYEKV